MEKSRDFIEVVWYSRELDAVMLTDETYHPVEFYLDDSENVCEKKDASHAVVNVEEELFNVPLEQFLRPH